MNIIVIGAGYGGITAALRLARLFRKQPACTIHLVDRNPYHTLKTQLHEAAVKGDEVVIPIESIIRKRNICFHLGNVDSVDLDCHVLRVGELSSRSNDSRVSGQVLETLFCFTRRLSNPSQFFAGFSKCRADFSRYQGMFTGGIFTGGAKMSTLTIRLPEEKHSRLKMLAKQRGVSLNKLMEELSTMALSEFDAFTRFKVGP